MKIIGMIGGTSWQSTVEYYRIINEIVAQKLGGHHSARIVMSSVDMDPLFTWANEGNWQAITDLLLKEVKRLEVGGSDFFILCANSMHKFADRLVDAANIPILHISEVVAKKVKEKKIGKVALLGTKFTVGDNFYQKYLSKYKVEIVIPDREQQEEVDRVIYNELVHGDITDSSRAGFVRIIDSLIAKGAEGVILGCTEIPLLIKQEHVLVPVFDTTRIHAEAAAEIALS